MATFKSQGIVIKSLKYRESSLIVDIYSREKGLRSYIVNGVRKAKSRMSPSLFQHGTIVDMIAYDSNPGRLSRIKEISLSYHYNHLPFEIGKSSIALFLLELIQTTIKESEQNFPLYEFLEGWLKFIDVYEGSLSLPHIKFMAEYPSYLGFKPMNNQSDEKPYFHLEYGYFVHDYERIDQVLNKEVSHALRTIFLTKKEDLPMLHIPKHDRELLINGLLSFYKWHIDDFRDLKSYDILKQLF
ncbi:MAG: DNA repair protein RecO [Saprospiraceae bacterium]|nr:DNA repair protein RecO [Saprospiraceae bacterium]